MQRGGRKRPLPPSNADAGTESTQKLELNVLTGACCQPACQALLPKPDRVGWGGGCPSGSPSLPSLRNSAPEHRLPAFPRPPPTHPRCHQIPVTFTDAAQYRQTFEPLLLEEARGSLRSELDEAASAGRGWPVTVSRCAAAARLLACCHGAAFHGPLELRHLRGLAALPPARLGR
jgi:hypothetical protein